MKDKRTKNIDCQQADYGLTLFVKPGRSALKTDIPVMSCKSFSRVATSSIFGTPVGEKKRSGGQFALFESRPDGMSSQIERILSRYADLQIRVKSAAEQGAKQRSGEYPVYMTNSKSRVCCYRCLS